MGGDELLLFQHLEDAADGFAGAADDLSDLLTGDLDLHAIRVGHGIRLFGQVEQGLGDPAGHIQEGEVADFLAGMLQTLGHLAGEAHQDIRVDLDQLAELLVGDLCDFAGALGTNPGGTLRILVLLEHPHLAQEVALVQVGEDHLFALIVLDQDGHSALDDVVEGFRFFTRVDQGALGGILMNVAVRQEPFQGGIALRFANNHENSSVVSFLWTVRPGKLPTLPFLTLWSQ